MSILLYVLATANFHTSIIGKLMQMINIAPQYYGYKKGTWANITICNNRQCRRTALYEDQHPTDCCPDCGETVAERVGKWHDKVTKGKTIWPAFGLISSPWFKTETIKEGYWEVKPEGNRNTRIGPEPKYDANGNRIFGNINCNLYKRKTNK
jgi:hypothetical protein